MKTKQKRTKMALSLVIFVGMVVLSLAVTAGSLDPDTGPAPTMKTLEQVEPRTPIASVPYTITQSGSYYLAGNLTSTGNGITVNADDVTIDLMGYTLAGPGSGTNYGIFMETRMNVEIKNGTIRDFGKHGICDVGNPNRGHKHRMISVRVIANGEKGIYLPGRGQLIKECTVAENGDDGIEAGYDSTLTGNKVHKNDDSGIVVQNGNTLIGNNSAWNKGYAGIRAGLGCTLIGNNCFINKGHGIVAYDGCTVKNNSVRYNDKHGIIADDGCLVIDNTVNNNNIVDSPGSSGIEVSDDCLVKNNTVTENKQCNIYVASTDNAIEENLVTDSSGFGIRFFGSNNFYANNRASGNNIDYGGNVPTGSGDGGGNVSF